jgi:hypothetical protein
MVRKIADVRGVSLSRQMSMSNLDQEPDRVDILSQ